MHADSVRLLPGVPPPPAPPGPQATTSSGVVTAVSASSLTIKASSGELTFTIDEKTKVVGTGMGTQSQKMKQAGQTTQITDFVSNGDTVTVRSTEAGGAKRASEVRVTKKAT